MNTHETFSAWLTGNGLDRDDFEDAPFLETPLLDGLTNDDRKLAWSIHVELKSRIATQPLSYHSGRETAALESLFSLFGHTRQQLHACGRNANRVGQLVLWVLNERVRPVTAYWHGASENNGLAVADAARDFRADLLALQKVLITLRDALGFIADDQYSVAKNDSEPEVRGDRAGKLAIEWTANAPELELIAKRRSAVGLEIADNLVGVALSGGGLRSATFSIGVLQALSTAGLYRAFDLLSTVSGGGYTGALISTWAMTPEADPVWGPFRAPADDVEPEAIRSVRNNSRYLVDGSPLEIFVAFLAALFGVLGAAATIGLLVLFAVGLVAIGEQGHLAVRELVDGRSLSTKGIIGGFILLALSIALASAWASTRFSKSPQGAPWWSSLLAAIAVVLGGSALVAWLRTMIEAIHVFTASPASLAAAVAAVPTLLTIASKLLSKKEQLLRIAMIVLAVSPPVALLLATAAVSYWLKRSGSELATGLVAAGVCLVVALSVDVNRHSLRQHYQARLARVFCRGLKPSLTDLSDKGPLHLINATLNLPTSTNKDLRDRLSAPMTFSKAGWTYATHDGKKTVWKSTPVATDEVDLPTAMAISGAAVSSLMGSMSAPGAAPWLTLFNLRLGYWVRNPEKSWSLPWGYYLLKELLGRASESDHRFNLTDGGHFENLGIFELIRRRCQYIIAIDGEADAKHEFGGLMKVIRLASIDFGATIRIDLSRLALDQQRMSRSHFALGQVEYQDGSTGLLLYIKLSITGDEPRHVLSYRAREPAFPHHSTADQLFSEEQFEAYRALGEHSGRQLFKSDIVGLQLAEEADQLFRGKSEKPIDLGRWFAWLEQSLVFRGRFDRGSPI